MREILQLVTDSIRSDRPAVLCTLVETRGSTPQKAGASMLVFPDGSQSGTLGGGCVEAEVRQRALRLLDKTDAELLTFHLDDNYGWDDGLICGGRMTILAEPLSGLEPLHYFDPYRQAIEKGDGCTEAVVVEPERFPGSKPGVRVLFGPDGKVIAHRHLQDIPASFTEQLADLATRPKPATRAGIAFLPFLPRSRLVIVGAGHVGQAVAELAARADFDVWVIDDRERYACPERFPTAERIIVGDMGQVLSKLETDTRTYTIIVTRGHSHDEEALFHLAGRPAAYLGMIGSKRKIRLIFDDLVAAGIDRDVLDRVHAPLGIHIGSQTVTEIAVSIVAELIAVRNLGMAPAPLRARGTAAQHDCLVPSPGSWQSSHAPHDTP
jgi:xanthine dehydrogenase accessory factor